MSLHRFPRALPPVAVILQDLGHPTAAALGAALGVSARTVWRWQEPGAVCPRAPHLALFFASRWGWSAVESDALHAVQLAGALADARLREVEALRAQVLRLESLGDFGAANSPLRALG